MKIGIVGCGITGTAVAHLLARNGHRIDIFEQAEECRPVGAGILLQPSGQQVLRRLGIFDQIADQAEPLDGLSAKLKTGRELVRLDYRKLGPDLIGLGVHRGELFARLFELCRLAEINIHTGSKIGAVGSAAGKHWVETDSGNRHEGFDFLIAADGAGSRIREASEIKTHLILYDYAALWATGPSAYQPGRLVQVVDGTEKIVGLLPIGKGRSSFFWGLPASEFSTIRNTPIGTWKTRSRTSVPKPSPFWPI